MIIINAAVTYSVIATNPANFPTRRSSDLVTQDITPPTLTLGNAPTFNCLNTSAQLTVQSASGVTFEWSGAGIIGSKPSNIININTSVIYIVMVTNPANGCTATASLTVTQY